MGRNGHGKPPPTELRDARIQLHWAPGEFWREHEPFVGAVLLTSTITAATDRHGASRRFLESAIAAGRALIDHAR